MKKLSILTMIFLFVLPSFSQGLNDICISSAINIYAVGNAGVFLKSTNGGTAYSSSVIGNRNIKSVYSIGSNIWCAADNGELILSRNSALSWTTITVSSAHILNSVYFTDTLTGYIAGSSGSLFKSMDGGNTWSAVATGLTFNLNEIKFIDPQNGYLAGDNNSLYRTSNGGSNWIQLATPSVSNLRCFDLSGNEIIAGSSENILYRSTNGGQNWTAIPLKIQSIPGINALAILSPNNYTIILESGTIWNTTNGGQSFTFAITEFMDQLNAVSLLGQRLFAVSNKQFIVLRSLNSGLTWNLSQNTTASISFSQVLGVGGTNYNKILEINYQKRGVLYVLAKDLLYRTLNYGDNWSVISTLPLDSGQYKSTQLLVSRNDSSKMLAGLSTPASGGDLCRIFRTSNYGQSWTEVIQVKIDAIGNFMTSDPSHPDTVYLGARDSFYVSADFGFTWQKISEYPFDDWCDMAVSNSDSRIIYASTNHYPAKINKSTDRGLTWNFIDFVLDTSFSEMPCIALSNLAPNVLLHAQVSGVVSQTGLKRSYSSGNSWLFNQLPGASWSVDIAKDDPKLYAFGSVSYDPLFLSTNSGGSFTGTSNIYAEQIMYYDRANLFVNNHGNISKMKYTYNMPVIGIQNISNEVPVDFLLEQNFPNPFNPETNINFSLPQRSRAAIIVYDITGKEVIRLVDEFLEAGNYRINWNASGYSSGIYFYNLISDDFQQTRKMVLVK
ncbi:MAG: T9SS type A sorting domain-containing protein [Ignavibacteria bacterium]|nr:T9SS type A sorting domain-containing protein [Ignavibacteria bacterium]